MNEPVIAYAWFRRPYTRAPGNWQQCTPMQAWTIVKSLRYRAKMKNIPVGEVLRAGTMGTRYEYICISVEVPPEVYEGIEEV